MRSPKISVNKLGEYLDATPSRRRRIVLDQQNPKPFITTRYADAREAIVNFVSGGMVDEESILATANDLRMETGPTDFVRQDKFASADAIEDFLDVSEQLEIDNLLIQSTDKTISSSMDIGGVAISIRPDLILKNPETRNIVGAIKLHFSKTNPLSLKSREYVATALRVHLSNIGNTDINFNKCYVVDIPTQQASRAPKAYKRKLDDIEAACEEMAARWS